MSTELAVVKQTEMAVAPVTDEFSQLQRVAKMFVASGFFQDTRDVAQAGVKIMAGKELGIPPMASMMGIHVIKGKVAMGATLIASRIRAHGYDFRVTRLDNTGCVIAFYGKAVDGKRPLLGESSFTHEDYKAAKISSEMYQKFPRNMYYSRAISNGARWYTPEVFGGSPVYTPDELGEDVNEDGEMERAAVVQEQATPTTIEAEFVESTDGQLFATNPLPE